MTQPICFLNGKYVTFDQACLPLNDLGIVRGYGVFDFIRTYNGIPFKLQEHVQRLQNSAKIIGLSLPWSTEEIEAIAKNTLERNNLSEANIRIVVTGGSSTDFITPMGKPSLMVIVTPVTEYLREYYEQGVKVITVQIERSLPGAKSLNYISAISALQQAKLTNAVEALYVDRQGHVSEGTTTNLFVFQGDKLITPQENILNGITREIVLQLAKDKFEIIKQPINYSDLSNYDEVFITATNKEIMPVVQIDELTISTGKPGANTQTIMDLFYKYTRLGKV
ncbi:MAG: aminotransferase class IV [Aphanothece sp. CMT-3BRIN-NPC111]|nr:aminotransferase class IV [Aphanothece sp. CMT-3BRIN-NPC111]